MMLRHLRNDTDGTNSATKIYNASDSNKCHGVEASKLDRVSVFVFVWCVIFKRGQEDLTVTFQ